MLPARFTSFANAAVSSPKVSLGARTLGLLGIGLWACLPLCAQDADAAAEGPGRSPFLPQGWEQRAQTATPANGSGDATNAPYVFNGLITIGSRTLYSISNTQTQQAMLVEMGENAEGVRVSNYDARRKVVTLSGRDGRNEELTLRKSDGEPLAATQQPGSRPTVAGSTPGDRIAALRERNGRRGPSTERLEAYHRRLGEQLERRRAEEAAAGGGGAVTVGVGNNAADSGGNNTTRARMNSGGGENNGQERPVRRRRLRLDMGQ